MTSQITDNSIMKPMHSNMYLSAILIGLIASTTVADEPFQPTWESLSRQQIPQWLKDAKFGVYTHWGVYSVPAHGGPDYVRNLYEGAKADKKGVYSYHTKKYGPLKNFGYKDFVPQFTAAKFNADEWVGLMHEAGAKFGGICLVHHDGFLLWDSKVSRWNSKGMGPKRDIYGEIAQAVRKYDDMKLLATFHHGRTFGYCTGAMKEANITDEMRKTWDVFDPAYADFYWTEFTGSPRNFSDGWKDKITEVVDKYQPDVIWFDGLRTAMRNDHPPESYVRDVLADYFNRAAANNQDVTVCNKHGGEFNFPESIGLRCYENGRDMSTDVGPWFLIDRAIAYPWSYVNNKRYRDGADYHVRSLVDLVSRGGIFLLSLTPKGDGSIPPEEQEIMRGIGRWLRVNGEAIYGTKPWTTYAEGPTVSRGLKRNNKGEEKEQWDWRQQYTAEDFRFTSKGDNLYAIALNWPEDGTLTVRSLAAGKYDIKEVSLLGHQGQLEWKQTADGLQVTLPPTKPCEWAFSLKITTQ